MEITIRDINANKNITLKFMVFSNQLQMIVLYKTDIIDFAALKQAKIVSHSAKNAKVILSGKIEKAITLSGVSVTAGARKAIEAAGGKVELIK